jgi:pSer/pThr/pTyr-binding forkhead associated (FHA) protein
LRWKSGEIAVGAWVPASPVETPALAAQGPRAPAIEGVLIGLEGPLGDTVHAVRAGEQLVGRTARCTLRLDSVYVSREHLRLCSTPEGVRVEPLSPTNPVLLNGNPIPRGGAALRDGDRLELGGTRFSFRTALP